MLDFFRGELSAQAILDYIDWLPRNSAYHTLLSEDEELAEAILNEEQDGDGERASDPSAPRLTEFGTLEELLTEIKDALVVLTRVQANWGSGKRIKPPRPSPRPRTAMQNARARHRRDEHERLKAALLPHKYGPSADTTPE